MARLLTIALRNIADDRGAFEWKPRSIKMEVFPADNLDVEPLLNELEEHDQVCRYEMNGKLFGAIRNFQKWQSPKYPSMVHPFPETLLSYVGRSGNDPTFNSVNSRNATRSTPGISGKSVQRERSRRGEGEEKKETSATAEVSPPLPAETPPAPADEKPRKPAEPPVPVKEAVELWNEICGPLLGRVQTLTEGRRTALRSRMVEHWRPDYLSGWETFLRRVLRSDFLTGRRASGRPWRADFDWLVKAANAVKVLEGRYDNDRPQAADDERAVAPGTV